MKYNPEIHKRHSIRLPNFDYANIGAYFVTVCLKKRVVKMQHDNTTIKSSGCDIPIMGRDIPIMGCDIPIMG
jgi:hypothetical protein